METRTDAERYFKAEALKLSEEVMKTRWRLLEAGSGIPRGFLAVMIFWLAVTFASFGLYAPRNATVISSAVHLCVVGGAGAVSDQSSSTARSAAYIRISPAPVRFVLENSGK